MIERDYSNPRGNTEYYRCECSCGNKNYVTTAKKLLAGKMSCGCLKRKKEFNKYEIREDITILYLERRNGDVYEAKIDTKHFDKIKELGYCWNAHWNPTSKSYYAIATLQKGKINGKRTTESIYLSRIIINVTDPNIIVDHDNHDTLDNREENLRETVKTPNATNRKGKNSNNKSGHRNVSKRDKWWVVQLQIEGKNTVLKKFPLDQLDEAGKYAEKMREKYYGEFKGKS